MQPCVFTGNQLRGEVLASLTTVKILTRTYGSSNSSSSSASASDRVIKVNLKNSRTIQPESLNVTSALGMDGSVEAKFELAFKSSDVAQAGDALKSFVQGPDEAQATFEERTDGDNTIYSAKIRGKDSAEFNTRIGAYLPGSEMTIHHPGGVNLFGADYTVSPKFNLQERFGQLQPKNYDFKFELPIMSSLKPMLCREVTLCLVAKIHIFLATGVTLRLIARRVMSIPHPSPFQRMGLP